jgi:hypothetical protein
VSQPSCGFIKIVARPDGEAPEWVRDAWIGVKLPLLRPEVVRTAGFGVVRGPRSYLGQLWGCLTGQSFAVSGYIVDAAHAVEMLGWTRPDAAAWWREHGGAVLNPGRSLVFDAEACEPAA